MHALLEHTPCSPGTGPARQHLGSTSLGQGNRREGAARGSLTQTLGRFLFSASLCFVGPTLTAILKYSVQPRRNGKKSKTKPVFGATAKRTAA